MNPEIVAESIKLNPNIPNNFNLIVEALKTDKQLGIVNDKPIKLNEDRLRIYDDYGLHGNSSYNSPEFEFQQQQTNSPQFVVKNLSKNKEAEQEPENIPNEDPGSENEEEQQNDQPQNEEQQNKEPQNEEPNENQSDPKAKYW